MGSLSTMTVFPMGHDRLAIGIGFEHATRDLLWAEQGLAPAQEWGSIKAAQKKAIALRFAHDVPVKDSMFARLFESFTPDWDSYKLYLWSMKDSDPLQIPYVMSTNTVVIGDAAHAFMPTIGMGASLAIEDAERLAARIAEVAHRYGDPARSRQALRAEAFAPFGRERVPVWNDLMYRSRWAGRGNFFRQRERRRFSIAPMIPGYVPSRVMGAIEWLAEKLHCDSLRPRPC
jgi:salicylate hydroxylase